MQPWRNILATKKKKNLIPPSKQSTDLVSWKEQQNYLFGKGEAASPIQTRLASALDGAETPSSPFRSGGNKAEGGCIHPWARCRRERQQLQRACPPCARQAGRLTGVLPSPLVPDLQLHLRQPHGRTLSNLQFFHYRFMLRFIQIRKFTSSRQWQRTYFAPRFHTLWMTSLKQRQTTGTKTIISRLL